ncbi:MAG TPA: putative metal-binding motif-containing protein, partial [Myxococcota bacterium]|nr:putative metal-binding motif-containing protein [Myxococcota bacterium]
MRLSPPGRRLRARLLFRVLTLVIAAVLGLGAFSAGCGSCRSRRGTGIYLEIPREVIVGANGARSLTLKIRIRAYDPAALPAGVPGVINDLPEQVIDLCPGTSCTPCASDDDCARDQFCEPSVLECRAAFEGRHGRSILIDPGTTPSGDPSPYDGIKAVVHFAVFADTTDDVRDAFAVIDDPFQQLLTCGSLPCSHAPLAALNALGAYSLSVDRLGHDDADIVMYPLNFDGVDVDPDGDTIPGQGAGPSEDGCVPFLRNPDYSWNSQRVNACESIFFIEPGTSDQSHFDCDDTSITANPFEVESGDVAIGRCIDGIDEDCRGGDGPCLDTDGDGFPGGPGADCNDADPDVHPGASELQCDNVDQDCNGADDCPDCDLDDDGYCVTAVGVIPGGDCCDAGTEAGCGGGVPPSAIHPGAPDVCGNGVDENCDGTQPICADPDADGDGFCSAEYDCGTDPTSGMDVCVVAGSDGGRPVCCLRRETIAPADLAACAGFDDCEDWDSSVHPGGSEICGNGVDDDCDPLTLDACPPGDADGDGFPAGPDCNDANPDVHPGAAERCGNGIDEDCSAGDGLCGPATDFDGDTYVVCPPGQTTGCDCDDANAMVHPDAPEQCDGVDSDCDGVVNNGNPEANDAGGDPLPCYGNDAVNPPYVEVNSEAWRCRVGDTVCTATGDLVCIHYVRPDLDAAGMPADACDDDNVCNGRNDVCLPCAAPSGPDVRTAERDLDGDGCFPCGGATNLASPVITAGDSCTGTDCCDEGTETGFPMCSPANAPTMNTTSPELCSNQGVDNNCDGNGAQICGTIVAGDACTTGIPGICSGGVFGCNAALGCSPGAPNTDVGQACGLFCNPTTCPYVTPELCDTPGIDNDCDG